MLVQIAVCKYHSKFIAGGVETGTSAGGEGQEYEGQEYEEVDGGKGGVALSDPTYMEVDGGGRGQGTPSNSRRMKLMGTSMPFSKKSMKERTKPHWPFSSKRMKHMMKLVLSSSTKTKLMVKFSSKRIKACMKNETCEYPSIFCS